MQLPEAAPMGVWPPVLAVAAHGDTSALHRHHCLHAILARDGRMRVEVGDERRELPGIVTGPDVPHAVDAQGLEVVILFVDPESVPGTSLTETLTLGARPLDGEQRSALLAGLPPSPGAAALQAWAEEALATLTGGEWSRPVMHPRVARLLRELRDLEPDTDTSLDALAARVKLSPSRLMHVFTESTGLPLRPYLRWLRFQRAAIAIVRGAPLSVAAAEAGFSDAAHMSRTCKQMFGLTPSALQRRSQRG